MAGQDGNETIDLIDRLEVEPSAADFFQTVRMLLLASRARGVTHASIGRGERLGEEPVRFRAAVGMRYASTEIALAKAATARRPPDLTVGFMGLTGPSGVLPDHYSELVVQRRRSRDSGLGDFLDLFNHRAISLFYRAWAKYRLPVRYEEETGPRQDPFSRALAALMGLGLETQRAQLGGDGAGLLSMTGVMARKVRSPNALQRILTALFELPAEVREFHGRWIAIAPEERTALGSRARTKGSFSALGVNAVLGEAVWDVQSRFRVRLGPLGLGEFRALFEPEGPRRAIVETIRQAVGPAVDFDLQLILRKSEAPPLRLGDPACPARLGQTTWLLVGAADRDRDDAVLPGKA